MLINKRRSSRLNNFDYSTPGYYFVTISTAGYRNLFGRIGRNNRIVLSNIGWIAEQIWQRNEDVYENFSNDLYSFMPNHLHALVLLEYHGVNVKPPPNLSTVIRSFKGCVTKEVRRLTGQPQLAIWQNNYHERIVNSDRALQNIREYIQYNPLKLEQKLDELRGIGTSI